MKKEITHTSRILFSVEEVVYSDGIVRYDLQENYEDGTHSSTGMFNDIDLLVHVLKVIGKIDMNAKTFVSK